MSNENPKFDRRSFIKASLAVAGAAGLNGFVGETQASTDTSNTSSLSGKPNILIITVDEQRYPTVYESTELSAFRKSYLKTQEALRQNGIEFQRHYTGSVACVPSRTTLYTGHYPSLHGVANTDGTAKAAFDADMFWLDPNSVPTMGNYFKAAGYRTFYKGKWHVSHVDLMVPGSRETLTSYDDNGERDADKEARFLAADRMAAFGFTGWIGPEPHGSDPLKSASSAKGKSGRDAATSSQMIDLLNSLETDNDDTPWLAVCSFLNPHDIALYGMFTRLGTSAQNTWDFSVDTEVPQQLFNAQFTQTRSDNLKNKPTCQASYREQYRKMFQPTAADNDYYRLYYQLHKDVDEEMAKVYQALKNSRFYNDTIVVFTSDHGDLLGSHGGLHQKWFTAYEEALRVPLIFSYPALYQQPETSDLLTSHVDILPTLLGLAGLDADGLREEMQADFSDALPLVGKDISEVILQKAPASTLDEPIYFMTDDDPSRGSNPVNFIGLSYASVKQPGHIETVVTKLSDSLWKYSRYFDNPQYWSDPGTPGDQGVQDETLQEIGNKSKPGSYLVKSKKTVKVSAIADEFEMYNLSSDPMELNNLAGKSQFSAIEAQLKTLLSQQRETKRLSPSSGSVPGQS